MLHKDRSIIELTFVILWVNKKKLLSVFLFLVITFSILAFFSEKKYKSECVFQVKAEQSGLPIPEGLKMLDSKFKSGSGISVVEAIISSRALAWAMIKQFNLMEKYDTKWEHLAIRKFQKNLESDSFEDGVVYLSFTYPNQDSVKIILDSILGFINSKSIFLSTEKANREYNFNKSLLDSVMIRLDSLGNASVKLLNEIGVADFEKHIELSLELFKDLQNEIFNLEEEYEIGKLGNIRTETELLSIKKGIDFLTKKKNLLTKGKKVGSTKEFDLTLNYDSIPHQSFNLEKIKLLVEKDKKILRAIIPLLEQSRQDMLKSTPILSVIDSTFVPPYKSGPKRAFIVIGGTIVVFLGYLILMLVWQVFKNPNYRTENVTLLLDKIKMLTSS